MCLSVTPASDRYGEAGSVLKDPGVHLSDTGVCCRVGVIPFEVSNEMLLMVQPKCQLSHYEY